MIEGGDYADPVFRVLIAKVIQGCCTVCEGTGVDETSLETGGCCWDCYGTGHTHDAYVICEVANGV